MNVLTTQELADRWKLSLKTIQRMVSTIPGAFRPGGGKRSEWRIPEAAVEAYERGERPQAVPVRRRETSLAELIRKCPQHIR